MIVDGEHRVEGSVWFRCGWCGYGNNAEGEVGKDDGEDVVCGHCGRINRVVVEE